MSAYRARRRRVLRLVPLSVFLSSVLVGCGGSSTDTGAVSTTDPKAGTRRKEMADYMKNQPPGGSTSGTGTKP